MDMRSEITEASPFLQGKPAFWASRIVTTECFLGDSIVTGAVVRAASRRFYEGAVVEVITERGRKFTATPNHPMLTNCGWIGAGALNKGDNLVCYIGKQYAGATLDKNVTTRPTTISQIFDTLATIGVRERRKATQPDFHGDGFESDIDIFSPDGELGFGMFAPLTEPLIKQFFPPTDDISQSAIRASDELRFSVDQHACFRGVSNRNIGFLQAILDHIWVYTKRARQCFDAFAGQISSDEFIRREILNKPWMPEGREPITSSIGTRTRDFFTSHHALDSVDRKIQLVRSTFNAQSRDIEFDRVLSLNFRQWSGHVYNLSTADGYYTINGAYTSNCQGMYNRAGWEANREANDQLGDMVKITSGVFDDRTASDSYASHGQIRLPDEAFETWFGLMQHPPDRPQDRAIVVPHRIAWPIPDYLRWKTNEEIARRWAMEKRKGPMPPRPTMTTIPLERFGKG
jgi:hypothetical protein